jgi:MFS family permease
MSTSSRYTATIALFVALGGFLMGFDASVISGVVGFIEVEFSLTKIQVGWSVSSLALTATLAMMLSGPLSDRIGRRPVLRIAALLFAISAIASALAPSFYWLVVARSCCLPYRRSRPHWHPVSIGWLSRACWAGSVWVPR